MSRAFISFMTDSNPRPSKRPRVNRNGPTATPGSSKISALPAQQVIPTVPIHPPNHPLHLRSLSLSLESLRKFVVLDVLDPDVECKAWCSLAEVGMMVVKAGFTTDVPEWAVGVEDEVRGVLEPTLKNLLNLMLGRKCY